MTVLTAENLRVARGKSTLLRDVSLTFHATESVAIIGPNGAGKSTLLKALAGTEAPTDGQVRLGRRNLAELPAAERAQEIGFLPQHFEPHWDLSVVELLEIGAGRARSLPVDALENTVAAFELGGLERRRWSTLSGGERARVLLAMVLVVDPPVLLADEPAASLDIRHRLDLLKALAERGEDRLSVVVVHDLDLAFSFFDRVVVLARGELIADGPAAELVSDPRLDDAFGVRFERLRAGEEWHLRACR
ncbi:MAG: ABC transporter ATP-binding protein [Reyranella sp.]|uniref:ABC transporter ATP-binding protein n=1 Tax=Reyranella sp. TaxID=1929291 RepID=UPI001AC97637|nr:ABC transporter ATP-binding protein [Reyranella sp.]MBN9091033.1 ABC transporter ATP-binding protein [Reyranella sp.]